VIDWILAERIAGYVAGHSNGTVDTGALEELAAESERRVTAYTGLEPATPLPPPEGISRREWVSSNVEAMKKMLDPVLERAGEGLGPLRPAMQLGIGVVVTTEVGVVLGYLAQRVLGQYELVLLDPSESDRPPRLLFVVPNLGQAVEAFGAEEREFMTWVALHEVTHAVQFSGVPWLQGHMAGLVRELLRSAELRIDTPRKLRLPSRAEVSRVGAALRRGDMIGLFTNQAERETLDRVQATMAVIEGHAEHVMDVVAPDLLPSLPKLRAALDRRRKSQSALSRIVSRLLGMEMKMRQYEQGKRFCDAVVAAGGPDALHRVFSSPEALPTLAELQNPRAWLLRTTPKQLPAGDR
jgi:coenzyme F420 biosynthesis associated uncharacterized protein